MMSPSFKSALLVTAGAVLTVIVADGALGRFAPLPPPPLEVEEGVAAYQAGNPHTLMLGSSHTRSFRPVRDTVISGPGADPRQMILIPVEWGTFTSYRWVLEHRLRPLIEETDGTSEGLRRNNLARVILVTEFYDMCRRESEVPNLPARAWSLSHFAADVAHRGLNDFNRNYLQRRYHALFPGSVLVQERGHPRLLDALKRLARGEPDDEERAELRQARIDKLRGSIAGMYPKCADPGEGRALEEIVTYFRGRNMDVTIVLFPHLRTMIPAEADAPARYVAWAAELGRRTGVRIVDMTYGSPLDEMDFEPDLEHVNAEGNRKLADWALAGGLAFLRQPPPRAASLEPQEAGGP